MVNFKVFRPMKALSLQVFNPIQSRLPKKYNLGEITKMQHVLTTSAHALPCNSLITPVCITNINVLKSKQLNGVYKTDVLRYV